jgi:hypothetical protein
VKAKYLVGLVLVLVGTNLFTFATTRYQTTRDVLTAAKERVTATLRKEGYYDTPTPADPHGVKINLAISQAGGMYYWWNDGLVYWGAAVVLTLSGFAVMCFRPRENAVEKL